MKATRTGGSVTIETSMKYDSHISWSSMDAKRMCSKVFFLKQGIWSKYNRNIYKSLCVAIQTLQFKKRGLFGSKAMQFDVWQGALKHKDATAVCQKNLTPSWTPWEGMKADDQIRGFLLFRRDL